MVIRSLDRKQLDPFVFSPQVQVAYRLNKKELIQKRWGNVTVLSSCLIRTRDHRPFIPHHRGGYDLDREDKSACVFVMPFNSQTERSPGLQRLNVVMKCSKESTLKWRGQALCCSCQAQFSNQPPELLRDIKVINKACTGPAERKK